MERKSVKILSIGNSFGVDATVYLYDIFKTAGYEEVVIGTLYIGGCSLDMHRKNIEEDAPAYDYFKNDDGEWKVTRASSLFTALREEEWEFILLQQQSGRSGVAETYNEDLEYIVNYVNANKTNANAKLFWHMTWAYAATSTREEFVRYGNDQTTMYNGICNAAQTKIDTNSAFAGVIPSGTTVQNLRSLFGDTLTRDGFHLTYDVGRFAAALTWYAALTGNPVEDFPKLVNLPTITFDYGGMRPIPAAYLQTINAALDGIKQSVARAIKTPYAVQE